MAVSGWLTRSPRLLLVHFYCVIILHLQLKKETGGGKHEQVASDTANNHTAEASTFTGIMIGIINPRRAYATGLQ